jgi:hypothetical protein
MERWHNLPRRHQDRMCDLFRAVGVLSGTSRDANSAQRYAVYVKCRLEKMAQADGRELDPWAPVLHEKPNEYLMRLGIKPQDIPDADSAVMAWTGVRVNTLDTFETAETVAVNDTQPRTTVTYTNPFMTGLTPITIHREVREVQRAEQQDDPDSLAAEAEQIDKEIRKLLVSLGAAVRSQQEHRQNARHALDSLRQQERDVQNRLGRVQAAIKAEEARLEQMDKLSARAATSMERLRTLQDKYLEATGKAWMP